MSAFDKIIGYDDEKFELKRICDILKNTDKYKKFGVTSPRGLLLEGDPGLGKTLMASCVIEESGRKTYTLRKTKTSKDFLEEITQVFGEAKANAPSIVFLDDMDKFANEDSRHKNAEEFVTLQACIDDVKHDEVFVLATANELDCLPDSLLRAGRFDKVMTIAHPSNTDGTKIVEYYLGQKNCMKNINAKYFARLLAGRSCAEIESVINDAGILATFEDKSEIGKEDILEACMRMVYKAPKSSSPHDPEVLEMVAYHEAGHTVVAELLEADSVTLTSVCKGTGDIGGITNFCMNPNYFKYKKYMDNRVMALLAGRAAHEMIYGDTDVGATNDLKRAYEIIERYVEEYSANSFDSLICHRRGDEPSDAFKRGSELRVQIELEKFYNAAKKRLIANREFLDKIAKALIKKQTLLGEDIQAIKATCTLVCA
ncbi:MAG: AAA family ATPase [Clostridia bacterium]|nr:AAA family ATPase [Clostridia bacterium]